jgi:hypothetical protein
MVPFVMYVILEPGTVPQCFLDLCDLDIWKSTGYFVEGSSIWAHLIMNPSYAPLAGILQK